MSRVRRPRRPAKETTGRCWGLGVGRAPHPREQRGFGVGDTSPSSGNTHTAHILQGASIALHLVMRVDVDKAGLRAEGVRICHLDAPKR